MHLGKDSICLDRTLDERNWSGTDETREVQEMEVQSQQCKVWK